MTEDTFIAARRRVIEEARALLAGERAVPDFFRAFMALVRDLAGDDGLNGVDLDVFKLLETWEESVGPTKASAETALRTRLAQFVPPPSYREPLIAWVVEYSDPREPGAAFQAGAFTTEAQAQRLLDQLEPAEWRADLRLNMIPVYETVEDWEWER
jgi:hypothetical protein